MIYAVRVKRSGYWFHLEENGRPLFHPCRVVTFDSIDEAQGVIDDHNLHNICEIIQLKLTIL